MMKGAPALVALAVAAGGSVAAPRDAAAFCGFYVAGGDQQMFNDATQVVLMRMGTRTVLSMQNNYKGPPEAFAMVVPVPVVLHEGDVKTLPREVFERVDRMGAPRLVEYWEQDPCAPPAPAVDLRRAGAMPAPTAAVARSESSLGVTIEAKFTVGEYQVVILSAKDSTGLETWLGREKYRIPEGAEPLLRPYVEGGSKFFVAKVDPAKVAFDADGRAALSPLRFHYDSEEFALPIRLGLASSSGTQDLIVSILAPHQRYEVANYKNVTIPTNLDVLDRVRDRFPAFYAALFDRTLETHPGAVVTEYAWQASTCDPCPGPTLNQGDFATLGADVIGEGKERGYRGWDLVLTRLHARYGKAISSDLVFRAADPIAGGREFVQRGQGELEDGARPAPQNNFQGRYAIRHSWTGPIRCEHPVRKVWGGPPAEIARQPGFTAAAARPAVGLAFAPRGEIALTQVLRKDVPEIGLAVTRPSDPTPAAPVVPMSGAAGSGAGAGAGSGTTAGSAAGAGSGVASGAGSGAGSGAAGSGDVAAAPPGDRAGPRSGCGCASRDARGGGAATAMLAVVLLAVRRRRRGR
jgi:MYXO-CTERM domain-containing protein